MENRAGYDAAADIPLPENRLYLAQLADIPPMLALINTAQPPRARVQDIAEDIANTLSRLEARRSETK